MEEGAAAWKGRQREMSARLGRALGECLGGAGPVHGGGGQQRAPGHGGEYPAGSRLFQ